MVKGYTSLSKTGLTGNQSTANKTRCSGVKQAPKNDNNNIPADKNIVCSEKKDTVLQFF